MGKIKWQPIPGYPGYEYNVTLNPPGIRKDGELLDEQDIQRLLRYGKLSVPPFVDMSHIRTPTFRKKPVTVHAVQWQPGKNVPGVIDGGIVNLPYVITTNGTKADVRPGDWVIAESDGEHYYPCDPLVFQETYEPADLEAREAWIAAYGSC